MLYVLIKLWEDSGKPDTQVLFSSRALASMLKKKGWGSNVISGITKCSGNLRTIPIEWLNSYSVAFSRVRARHLLHPFPFAMKNSARELVRILTSASEERDRDLPQADRRHVARDRVLASHDT